MNDDLQRLMELVAQLAPERLREFAELFDRERPRHSLEAEWGVSAGIILDAIARSSDLTRRGIRGVIAEAVFESSIVPTVTGWTPGPVADEAFDFQFESGDRRARIQVKLQRLERRVPKMAGRPYPPGMFVVEVQRTRTGRNRETGENTRPYAFTEFDILAVCMHPSSGRWTDFLFTLTSWLVPRENNPNLIAIMQPVPPKPNRHWTRDLNECLEWFRQGRPGRLYPPS